MDCCVVVVGLVFLFVSCCCVPCFCLLFVPCVFCLLVSCLRLYVCVVVLFVFLGGVFGVDLFCVVYRFVVVGLVLV